MGDAAARKGVLHHREADQHDDEHESAEQSRADDVVGEKAEDGERRADHPDDEQQPGRDQHDGAVVIVGGEIDDQRKAEHGDEEQGYAGDARSDVGREQSDRDKRAEECEPAGRDMGVAHVPAIEIQISEQEHQQRCGKDRLAGRAPDTLGARRHVEHLGPKSKVDADIDQHRPAQRGSGREHHAAFDDEQDGQEEREQAGDADDDALVERERIDLVLVRVGFPQIELRQVGRAQFGDEGNDGAGVEGNPVNVGARVRLQFGRVAGGRRYVDDARLPQIRPKQTGAHHPVMRRHDEPVDLLIAVVGEREDGPVGVGLARAHLDAAHDPIRTRCRRNLDAIAVGVLKLDGAGEVDGRTFGGNVDRFNSSRGRYPDYDRQHERQRAQLRGGTGECQWMSSELSHRRGWAPRRSPISYSPKPYRTVFVPNSRLGFAKLPKRAAVKSGRSLACVTSLAAGRQGFSR